MSESTGGGTAVFVFIGLAIFAFFVGVIIIFMSSSGGFFPSKTNKFSVSIVNTFDTAKNSASPCGSGK